MKTLTRLIATTGLLGSLSAGLLMFGPPAEAVDLGDASVLSQRGQRLKIAVPYGSAPGERMPITRFSVQSVSVPAGYPAVSPQSITLSKPERRNVLFLQSSDAIAAPQVKLVLAVQDGSTMPMTYQLAVPPGRAAPSMGDDGASRGKARKPLVKSGGKHRTKPADNTEANAADPSAAVGAGPAPTADASALLRSR